MNVQTFKTEAAKVRAQLVLMEEAREDLALLCATMKLATGLTNMQMREVKRLLKAEVKGTMDKIEEQDEASEYIRELLGIDKKVVDKNSVDHDPETGEIIESPVKAGEGDGVVEGNDRRLRSESVASRRSVRNGIPEAGIESGPSPANTEKAASPSVGLASAPNAMLARSEGEAAPDPFEIPDFLERRTAA